MSKVVANTSLTLDVVMQASDEDTRGSFEYGGCKAWPGNTKA